jgi:hypothetical protein
MYTGILRKMKVSKENEIRYFLRVDEEFDLNSMLGQEITISWTGRIFCQSCGKQTKKSFGEGFCYPCFTSAPEAAECIIRPELCRAHLGQGRDPEWEQINHNIPHVVYLAASSKVKVGVTRQSQIPTRWIDQGASSAIVLALTPNRYEAGNLEVALKSFYTDKTNWQHMLKNEVDDTIDLIEEKWNLFDQLPEDLRIYFSEMDEVLDLKYPVRAYPMTITSVNLDKVPQIRAVLEGIKGQYLIFDGGLVFNVRRHTGYEVNLLISI